MSAPLEETVAFRMTLDPGQAEAYRRRHDDIWPELTQALIAAGVIDYRIWLDPQSHHLFAVLRRRVDHTLDRLPDTEVMQRWWAMMADIMQTHADNVPIQVDLTPMFHLQVPARGGAGDA
jgi:L-rhamnose mutarotase